MAKDGLQPRGPKQPAFVRMCVSFLLHLVRKQTHRIFIRQSYFSMTTRMTSPCVHAATCPLSQPHHSLLMRSNPRTSMMEVASRPSDEVTHLPLFVCFLFMDILGLLGAESKKVVRGTSRRGRSNVENEINMHCNVSRKYEWLIPQWCTMHLWQFLCIFSHCAAI
ncbi:hypothetical protein VPH35_021055 [Triticum aestivum]